LTLADLVVLAALFFGGAATRQLGRFHQTIAEFSRAMAVAQNSRRAPLEYQNAMTPRWLLALLVVIGGAAIYLIVKDGNFLSDICVFASGFFLSGALSTYWSWPKSTVYARSALRTLRAREAAYRRVGKLAEADDAKHFHWLLTELCGAFLQG
jgi:hypothetical protein